MRGGSIRLRRLAHPCKQKVCAFSLLCALLACAHAGQVMHGGNIRLGPLFSCLPTTFTLPKDLTAFTHAFGKAAHGVEPSVTQPKGLNLW